MIELPCVANKSFDNSIRNILLQGLIRPVVRIPGNLELYCTAKDQYGNRYDIFTDYDIGLKVSYTVAVRKED